MWRWRDAWPGALASLLAWLAWPPVFDALPPAATGLGALLVLLGGRQVVARLLAALLRAGRGDRKLDGQGVREPKPWPPATRS